MPLEIIDAKDMTRSYHKGISLLSSEDTDLQKDHSSIQLVDIKDIRVGNGGRSGIGNIDEFRYIKSPDFDNIHSSIYLNFVQRYIRQIIGAYRKGKYWIMNVGGRGGLKVKHISACLRTTYNEYAWYYPIKFDDGADAFLLSAFSDRITMEPMHLWFIYKNVVLHIGDMQKPIWNRARLVINERMVSELRSFEMHDHLLSLTEIMKKVSLAESEKNSKDLRRRLIVKQHDIRKKTGYNFKLDFLIHQAVYTGLVDIEKLYGLDGCSELVELHGTTLNAIKELEYVLNKQELDNELIESLKNLSVVIDVRTSKLIESAMSIGIDKLNIDIVMDMIKIEEFIKTNKEFHGSRHVGSWKGRKDYIKGMNPIIREGLSTILRNFYIDMMR
jgi:hypothetical protein